MARSILGPLILNYGKVRGFAETTIEGVLLHLYEDFITNSKSVNSREISHGSPSAGSNIGSGTINRLFVDENGYEIENIHTESLTAECVRDEHLGAEEHREVWRIRGENLQPDQIVVDGSGIDEEVKSIASDDSLISNPSWSQRSGTDDTPTELTDWTVNSIANFDLNTTDYYRESSENDSTPKSLQINADEVVSQAFSVNNVTLDRYRPYYAQIAYNRSVGSANGTLLFRVGTRQASVALGGAGAGWNILRIAIGIGNWPKRFANEGNPRVEVILTGRTTGYVLVDDIVFAPYVNVGGTYYAPVGGATPFLRGDSFSWTDSLGGADAIIQYYLFLAFGFALPAVTGAAETWADPSV